MKAAALCRPEAYQHFRQSLIRLDTTSGLLQAATAVAMHALDDVDPRAIDAKLDRLAARVTARIQHRSPETLVAHLHDVLFEEVCFQGEAAQYYNPLNSYLPAVLESKRGIPITLSLIYKVVGERAGLTIEGINAPAHFMVRVHDGNGWLVVDPFHGGAVHSAQEAFALMERILGRSIGRSQSFLEPATHAQWITRLLANLQHIFAQQGAHGDLAAMTELQSLLNNK